MLVISTVAEPAVERVRRNVEGLMEKQGVTQVQLAERLHKSQSWVSKRVSGRTPFKLKDLDDLAHAFAVSPESLLHEFGTGGFERRTGRERRVAADRRRTARIGGLRDDRQSTFRSHPSDTEDDGGAERAS